jgi:hypothetical protein
MLISSFKLYRLDVVFSTRCEPGNRALIKRPFADCWRDGPNVEAYIGNVEMVASWLPPKRKHRRVADAA